MSTDLPLVPLAELATVNPPVSTDHLEPDNIVSFIPMTDVTETGHWVRPQVRKLREVRNGYTPFQEGDVLFAKITPCMENGKGAHAVDLVNKVGFGTTEFHVLRTKLFTDARFIYHWLQSEELRLRAKAMMTGSAGQQRVPTEFFEHFKVPFLPLVEQHRIAEILDTLDIQIQETERLIDKLKQQKIGILHGLLTRGIDEYGELRDPVAHPEQFKDSVLGRIPREWEIDELSSVCNRITDGCHQSVITSQDGVPFLFVSCIRDGQIRWDQAANVTKDVYRQISKGREPRVGLILYTVVGSYGHAALVEDERLFSFQRHIAYILPNVARVIPRFLVGWLNSYMCRSYADTVALGNAQKTVTLGQLVHFPVPSPTLTEQHRIAIALQDHDTLTHTEETHLSKLKQIKKGLMHDLLTGRVRV